MGAIVRGFGCGINYSPGNHPERPCRGCGALFCPRRKDQFYPSEKCRWRSRDRSVAALVRAIGDPDEIEALGRRLIELAAAIRKSRSPGRPEEEEPGEGKEKVVPRRAQEHEEGRS